MMVYDWQLDESKKLGLKPCQCGGIVVIGEIGNAHTKRRCLEMKCTKCFIKRKQCIINSSGALSFADLKSGMIEKWNKRPAEEKLIVVLQNVREYFDQRADADQPSGSHAIANEEMGLLMEIDEVLK